MTISNGSRQLSPQQEAAIQSVMRTGGGGILSLLAADNAFGPGGMHTSGHTQQVVAAFLEPGNDISSMLMRASFELKDPKVKAATYLQFQQALFFAAHSVDTDKLPKGLAEIAAMSFSARDAIVSGLINSAGDGKALNRVQTVLTGGMWQSPDQRKRRGWFGRGKSEAQGGLAQ